MENCKPTCPTGTNKYIGFRYVPKIKEDNPEWDNSIAYEPLIIVTYQGSSYTSRTFVPIGAEITNTEFWVLTGNYNAQVELYRQEVENVKSDIIDIDNEILGLEMYKRNAINILSLGVKNDGVFDNTDLLNSIFGGTDYFKTYYFPNGTYNISNSWLIKNMPSLIFERRAVINVVGTCDYAVIYQPDVITGMSYYDKSNNMYITGMTINSNFISNGIALNEYLDLFIQNCRFFNFLTEGLKTRYTSTNTAQLTVDSCMFYIKDTSVVRNAYAINDNGYDCYFNNIMVINCKKGIFTHNSFFNHIHIWCTVKSFYEDSVFIETDGHPFITNSNIDTCNIGFKNVGNSIVTANHICCVQNTSVTNGAEITHPCTLITVSGGDNCGIMLTGFYSSVANQKFSSTAVKNAVVTGYYSPNSVTGDMPNVINRQIGSNWSGMTQLKNADIDSLYESGEYISSGTNPILNLPESIVDANVRVFKYGPDYAYQRVTSIGTPNREYVRNLHAGIGAWRYNELSVL